MTELSTLESLRKKLADVEEAIGTILFDDTLGLSWAQIGKYTELSEQRAALLAELEQLEGTK